MNPQGPRGILGYSNPEALKAMLDDTYTNAMNCLNFKSC
jgi:hypothetical protein